MDLNATKIQGLQDQVDKLNLKVDAICKAFNIDLTYNPHSYDAYKSEETAEGE